MSTSFSFTQRFDVHELLFWAVACPVYRVAVVVDATCSALHALLPALLVALVSVVKALALVAAVAVCCAVVALVPAAFWLGMAIIAAFGWATFPRSKAVANA